MEKEISHFWLGYFKNEDDFDHFVEEDESYYTEEENEDLYVSKFAATQNIQWFDYDFLEYGFEDENLGIYEKFTDYSYADQWIPVIEQKINELGLETPVNAIIFANKHTIPNPVSVNDEEYALYYIGEIEYSI
ncbi:immunity 22 family protein [Chryseobacterium vrystaatense]|uniref:Immunity protein 22 n=1 Tax=Chryseobacterium vrystaatense TaxID=307480 RepID=A0A1M5A2T6_9FLAO|nr:immunity 22 family protein [Chryseobacterium vrystaatense]SHF24640.1 Immunity protein 22 [Chryseobacterium vrystaatense]